MTGGTILGVVLAGGQGLRMGGADKALLSLGGRSLVSRAVIRLAPQVAGLAISANGDAGRLAHLGLPVLADRDADLGPLSGVLAGLDWAAGLGARAIVTVAVDTPHFPTNLVAGLCAAADGADIPVLARSPGGDHPTFGLWPVALRGSLRAFLASGEKARLRGFADAHGARRADFCDAGFENLNTPDDLARARARLTDQRIYGVIGWKNAGKTGLMERLVRHITDRGFSVSTVKHVHHDVDLDQPGKDSFRHRQAGASEVVLASAHRFAILHEHRGPEPDLTTVLSRLAPVDLVLVEGYKRDSHDKIEVWRPETGHSLIQPGDPLIRAVASDVALPQLAVPRLDLNDTAAVAGFILREVGLDPV